jgi:hypothetical protein
MFWRKMVPPFCEMTFLHAQTVPLSGEYFPEVSMGTQDETSDAWFRNKCRSKQHRSLQRSELLPLIGCGLIQPHIFKAWVVGHTAMNRVFVWL